MKSNVVKYLAIRPCLSAALLAGTILLPGSLPACGPSSGEPETFLFSEIPSRSYGRLCIDSRLIDRKSFPAACGARTREEENAKEWASYLGISAEEARKGVYTQNGSPAFARALAQKPAARTYLDFARRVERIQVSTFGWDWEIENEQKGAGRAEAEKMIDEVTQKAANVKDSFLSPRYRLLKARLLLRAGRLTEILAVPVPDSPGFTRGQVLRLRAGASLRLKDPVSAAIQTILAYEASPSSGAADDFRYLQLQEKDFRKASASNLSAKQKALLFYLSGIHMAYNGSFALAVEDLESFWDADPRSPAADSLLLKTIALMEEEALPYLIFGQRVDTKSHRTLQEKFIAALAHIFPSLAADPVTPRIGPETQKASDRLLRFLQRHEAEAGNRPLWNAALAYTAYVAGDPDAAARLLEKKESNPALEARRRIILFLARIEKERRVSQESEADFVSLLPVLSAKTSSLPRYSEYDEKGRPAAELMLYRVLANAYAKMGSPEKAVLASYLTDTFEWYPAARLDDLPAQNLIRLRDYLKSPSSSPIDPILKKTAATPLLVADRLAAAYAREGKYAEAEKELSTVPPRKITLEFTGDFGPFDASWETRPDPARASWDRRRYFAEMARLTAEIEKKPNDPSSAMLYMRRGVGAMNASHFGKWWILMRDYWSSSHMFDRKSWENQVKLARNDFEKAAALSTDREFAARAVFLSAGSSLALNSPHEWTEEKRVLGKEEKASYTRLAKEFGDTRFVQTIGATCANLADFLSH